MMQRTANENAARLRRICKRSDQPKIERLVNNDARLILLCSPECDKMSSLPVFYVDEKFTHQVIYFNTKSSIFYVKLKIYTSSLLHCYQLPIFLRKVHICRSSFLL